MLTDREKFIIHYLAVAIVGAVDGKNVKAVKTTINKITDARGRNLDFDEREKIIEELNQEFMITGSFLNGLKKETKELPGDDDLV